MVGMRTVALMNSYPSRSRRTPRSAAESYLRPDAIGNRVEGFQPVTGVDHHGFGLGVEYTVGQQFGCHADHDPAGGLGKNALGTRQTLDVRYQSVVVDVSNHPARTPHHIKDVRPISGLPIANDLATVLGFTGATKS